jgi:hypothetical protein
VDSLYLSRVFDLVRFKGRFCIMPITPRKRHKLDQIPEDLKKDGFIGQDQKLSKYLVKYFQTDIGDCSRYINIYTGYK